MSAQSLTWDEAFTIMAPSTRCCSGMAYDPGQQAIVLSGGTGPGGPFGDTCVLQSSGWSQLSPATALDLGRNHLDAAVSGGLASRTPV